MGDGLVQYPGISALSPASRPQCRELRLPRGRQDDFPHTGCCVRRRHGNRLTSGDCKAPIL
eukprot:scaffold569_cov408-Prasinococcus_capsulatus_cf.AAC.52